MSLNGELTADFKQAAKSIFDNMISSELINAVYKPRAIDPVTGNKLDVATAYPMRVAISLVRNNRIPKEGYHTGDITAYVLFDEVTDFQIVPGAEVLMQVNASDTLLAPKIYTVVSATIDAAEALYTLQLRMK